MDPLTVPFPIHSVFNATTSSFQFEISPLPPYLVFPPITHRAWTQMVQLKQFLIPSLTLIIPMLKPPMIFSTLNPVPLIFSNHFFSPLLKPYPSLSPSSPTDASPILSPLSSIEPDAPSPITDDQLEHNLDEFIFRTSNS